MGSRRKAREHALQMLYQADISGLSADETTAMHWRREPESDELIRAFTERLVDRVLGNGEKLDSLLNELSHNWPLERLGAVDRALLRIALSELELDPNTPAPVIIDEAVELAKEYGDSESGSFVNGILEAARKRLRPDPPPEGKGP